MGKRGPCSHCGVKCTPLWRNGPSEKPVLCNACGSRYRIRGTLANYTPKNVHYLHRRRPTNVNHPDNAAPTDNNLIIQDDETDDSASSEDRGDIQSTTIESSISCEKNIFKTEDVEENEPRIYPPAAPFFGNFQPNISESHIPSRKRSEVVYSSSSLLEDLQRDLSKMLKYEEFYHLTESAMEEQVLIYNVDNPISSGDEIGLGGILLKPPTTSTEEGSSEAMEDKVPNLKPATRKSSSL